MPLAGIIGTPQSAPGGSPDRAEMLWIWRSTASRCGLLIMGSDKQPMKPRKGATKYTPLSFDANLRPEGVIIGTGRSAPGGPADELSGASAIRLSRSLVQTGSER
jgi:hypothetical protein